MTNKRQGLIFTNTLLKIQKTENAKDRMIIKSTPKIHIKGNGQISLLTAKSLLNLTPPADRLLHKLVRYNREHLETPTVDIPPIKV